MAVVRGRVQLSGRPASEVLLIFQRPGARRTETVVQADPEGRYEIELGPGPWDVRANVGKRIVPDRFFVRRGDADLRDLWIEEV